MGHERIYDGLISVGFHSWSMQEPEAYNALNIRILEC